MAEQPGGLDLHLDLHLDGQLDGRRDGRRGPGALGRSLESALRDGVRSGRLPPGTRLPGSRSLAADLGISRGTVVQAYTQLIAEGWLTGAPGSGTSVATPPAPIAEPGEKAVAGAGRGREAEPAVAGAGKGRKAEPGDGFWSVDLRPGRPDVGSFPRTAWASAVRRALATAPSHDLDYGDPAGLPVLRQAIAGYAGRARGVRAGADSVIVVGGFSSGLALLARALRGLGGTRIATEDPGLPRHRELVRAAGLETVPLAVDAGGADPAGLPVRCAAALLTPAHQHPLGVVLAPERRVAFAGWARHADGYLIEDDYDGEFRYDHHPVGALQALAPDRVVYAGSASKALAPGMRLGWLIVPPSLREPVIRAVEDTGAAVPSVTQLAFADLIERGEYDRHIRRSRLVYRRRRTELAQRLPSPLPGVAAGLHALLPLPSAERERRLIEAGRRAGVRLQGLNAAGYWYEPSGDRPAALLIGYAAPPRHDWRRALEALCALTASSA
ncbi:PLP-dependent aminotransferase family protein [Nonomuraea deserti]|uniref:PLP-dependent aminotransferase family protein n=1 Tax=Nonomuraea deserti TaxID=1848322 RepID=A0A4R4UZX7_9ACTN|nr:PLP-dependent aminotransferase family protein [Nonomuraea deserti]TDC97911.1 PLP-dependent aminotransferase family protein [Nonomuraea deserti]